MSPAVVLLVTLMQPAELHAEFVSLFEAREYRQPVEGRRERIFRYRLFAPQAPAGERLPLLVWLHGMGESGGDNVHQLTWLDTLVFRPPWQRDRYPFFLLAVQCPRENPTWFRSTGEPGHTDDMVDVAREIVVQLLGELPIDPDRVCLAGLSSGGAGCWEMAARYPELFSAAAPLAAAGWDGAGIARVTGLPVWVFHCNRDGTAPVATARRMVASLRKADGNVHLTEVDSAGHDSWSAAFADYHLLEWLLTQRRGENSAWYGPGSVSWRGRLANLARG